ncbi:MAG: hypothetical protein GWN14_23565, partial [candidate division Zixibacteria bacterium]|nr:hypothetical protein [candidate division Zixibacteria bacterium]NIX58817.1 hypothetical protein [candidate division Zixibacteria bacterium]
MEKIFNVPLILMYMGFDVDKAMLSSIARYLLTIIGGFMLAIQMYFGYLLLKLRGWKAIFRALVFFSVYILTIKFYID